MHASSSVARASLLARCPRCGRGALFRGVLTIAPFCESCGLEFAAFDVGDGPAALVILVVGALVCGAALYVEFTWSPPLWVHVLLWTPAIAVLTIFFLRVIKAALLILQYRHRAGEGRLAE